MFRDMKSLQVCALTFGVVSFLAAPPTSAQPLAEWGTEAGTSVADCPSFCTNSNFGPSGGEVNQLTASSSISESRGSADSFAGLTGGLSVPILKARGTSIPGMKGAGGFAFGSQGYTYSGSAKTIDLDVTLTGTLEDPGVTSRGDINATVIVFDTENYFFFSDLSGLLFEVGATPLTDASGIGDARVDFLQENTGSINQTQTVSFDVEDGDQFYIWAVLGAYAVSSSSAQGLADAFNTLGMSFPDPTGLTAASVPEPATFTMCLLAVVLAAHRRRD